MFVPVGINDELTLRIPQFFCCNCGSADEISSASTPLTLAFTHARYAGMFASANREAIERGVLRVVESVPSERRQSRAAPLKR